MIILAAVLIILPFVAAAGMLLALVGLLALWIYGIYDRSRNKGASGEELLPITEAQSVC